MSNDNDDVTSNTNPKSAMEVLSFNAASKRNWLDNDTKKLAKKYRTEVAASSASLLSTLSAVRAMCAH